MKDLSDILKSGKLEANSKIIWNRKSLSQRHLATINGDGTITTADGKKHKSPSGAARHLNGDKPVDGWIVWKLESTGIPLAKLRD